DVATMIDFAADRLVRELPMPGVVVIHQNLPINVAVEELAIFLSCSSQEEWENRIIWLPL
ncbi:MAG: DUF5615 family PIN-like protein, partial [Blastocatellia bacterium]